MDYPDNGPFQPGVCRHCGKKYQAVLDAGSPFQMNTANNEYCKGDHPSGFSSAGTVSLQTSPGAGLPTQKDLGDSGSWGVVSAPPPPPPKPKRRKKEPLASPFAFSGLRLDPGKDSKVKQARKEEERRAVELQEKEEQLRREAEELKRKEEELKKIEKEASELKWKEEELKRKEEELRRKEREAGELKWKEEELKRKEEELRRKEREAGELKAKEEALKSKEEELRRKQAEAAELEKRSQELKKEQEMLQKKAEALQKMEAEIAAKKAAQRIVDIATGAIKSKALEPAAAEKRGPAASINNNSPQKEDGWTKEELLDSEDIQGLFQTSRDRALAGDTFEIRQGQLSLDDTAGGAGPAEPRGDAAPEASNQSIPAGASRKKGENWRDADSEPAATGLASRSTWRDEIKHYEQMYQEKAKRKAQSAAQTYRSEMNRSRLRLAGFAVCAGAILWLASPYIAKTPVFKATINNVQSMFSGSSKQSKKQKKAKKRKQS